MNKIIKYESKIYLLTLCCVSIEVSAEWSRPMLKVPSMIQKVTVDGLGLVSYTKLSVVKLHYKTHGEITPGSHYLSNVKT